jgi:sterol desaturase/sphingolipid hydroxylase (fatty acid hydroxylase superfamily)
MTMFQPFLPIWERWYTKNTPGELEAWISMLAQMLGFFVPAATYTAIVYVFPNWSSKHRLQKLTPTAVEGLDALVTAILNIMTVVSMHTTFLAYFRFQIGLFRIDSSLPTLMEILWQWIVCSMIREVAFYWAHRFLHTSLMYRLFHEKHHRYKAPIALAAIYSHPIDHFLQNALPIAIPLMIVRAHIVTVFFIAAYFQWDAALAHSGFNFTRLPEVEEHDRHHRDMKVNFGVLGWMDRLHGTDARSCGFTQKACLMEHLNTDSLLVDLKKQAKKSR